MGLKRVPTRGFAAAIEHLVGHLPPAERWLVVFQPEHHSRIARSLKQRLAGNCELVPLGQIEPARLRELAERHLRDAAIGFLELLVVDGTLTVAKRYGAALDAFWRWGHDRLRLCFDVTDANAMHVLADSPRTIAARCRRLHRRLEGVRHVAFEGNRESRLHFDCRAATWTTYTIDDPHEYGIPCGEVATKPRDVEGSVVLEGWIVGTLPFGPKYGRIAAGDVVLTCRRGEVREVGGRRRDLCADLDVVFEALPPLRAIAELGIGQSRSAGLAAARSVAGCQWHEITYGVHVGLGATLPSDTNGVRATSHHLDLVFESGRLLGDAGQSLLRW